VFEQLVSVAQGDVIEVSDLRRRDNQRVCANPQADLAVGQTYLARELLGRLKLLGRLLGRLISCWGDSWGDSTEQCVCLQEVQGNWLEVVAARPSGSTWDTRVQYSSLRAE
jgi:hypothetical protein